MTGYFRMLVAAVALAALPGCGGGGGGGSTPAAQTPREPAPAPAPRARAEPTPEPTPEPAADPEPAPTPEPMAEPAAEPATRADLWRGESDPDASVRVIGGGEAIYRTIWRSAGNLDGIYGYDRSRTWAFEDIPGLWSPWVISSASDSHTLVSPLADRSGIRMTRSYRAERVGIPVFESSGGAVTDIRTDGAVFGRTVWNDGGDDNRRWSSWGWWMEYRSEDFIANAPRAWIQQPELGVFVDGPEFRASPASLPETGSATYRGPAMGVFASEVGEVDSATHHRYVRGGSLYAGEFTGSAEITMTYPGQTAKADHVTNIRISRMDGVRTNRGTGESIPHVRTFTASEGPAFRFEGYVTTLSNEGGDYFSSSSSLEEVSGLGMVSTGNTLVGNAGHDLHLAFSNVEGAGGNPRNIGGLFMVRAHGANKRDHFLGVFLAPLVTP